MTRLSSLQRKAALELIQDDLGILASEYMDEKEFVFDTELLSIEKQKRLFAYVNSMVRANRELWLQQQQVAANLGGAAAYRAQGGGSTASSAGGSPYPVGGEGASGVPGKGAGTEARRGKKKRDERNGAGSDSSSSDSDSSCSSSSSSFSDSSSASSSDSDDSDDTDDEKADADDAKKQARAAAASASTADEAIAMPTSQSKDGSSWNRDANSTALLPGAGVGHHAVAGGEPAAAPSSGAAASSGGTADGGAQLLTVSGSSGGPPSERASPPPGVSSSHQADFPGASAATAPRDGHASAAERLAAEGGAAAVATSREEGRREDASGSVPGQGEGMEPAAHAASCGAGAAARSGGLPQYTPVCEEGSDEIREEVMGRHADFFGAFDSQAPEEGSEETVGSQGLTAEAKSTAWKEWKGQVIQQGFVAQRAYATQDRSVNEIIAEGYDARI
ncbi:bromodomain-containing protein [Besnoitia besnoiti]|uniref:Bromodomain-containing protein n=1 Tax=Besnoitia besnoiti TaxID=94643 RepID=A0A2A9MLQ5_BESBE|nr:bromodomain-containing protein [Besnoitia besnoiti]PFH36607.1 bromodomain-containing protein [Besnoitia besnoiti]